MLTSIERTENIPIEAPRENTKKDALKALSFRPLPFASTDDGI